jgi:FkbM family methyltransferase
MFDQFKKHPYFIAAVCLISCVILLGYQSHNHFLSAVSETIETQGWPHLKTYYVSEASALQRAKSDANYLPHGAPSECVEWLNSRSLVSGFTSQFGQDSTIYYNFLAGRLANGDAPGFFVDVGANAPKELSNTYFLEKCLGWKGLCIEADPGLAETLRAERSCKVVNKCVDVTRTEVQFAQRGSSGHIATSNQEGNVVTVACSPLATVLKEHGLTSVDFLTIDIEGNELSALLGFDWESIPIEMLLIETAWSSEKLDMMLSDAGMWRVGDIAYLDDFYVRRTPLLRVPGNFQGRQQNWDFISEKERNTHKNFKRGNPPSV